MSAATLNVYNDTHINTAMMKCSVYKTLTGIISIIKRLRNLIISSILTQGSNITPLGIPFRFQPAMHNFFQLNLVSNQLCIDLVKYTHQNVIHFICRFVSFRGL